MLKFSFIKNTFRKIKCLNQYKNQMSNLILVALSDDMSFEFNIVDAPFQNRIWSCKENIALFV